jgi:hypothetical protein
VQKIDQEECVREGMVLGWWEKEEDKAKTATAAVFRQHPQTASQPEQLETIVQSHQSSKKAKSR